MFVLGLSIQIAETIQIVKEILKAEKSWQECCQRMGLFHRKKWRSWSYLWSVKLWEQSGQHILLEGVMFLAADRVKMNMNKSMVSNAG